MQSALLSLSCLGCWCAVVLGQSCSITLNNGKFSLMVGMAEDVLRTRSRGDRHDYRDLKQSLEERLTEASKWMYRATKNRAYFSDITVVVPDAWSADASFQCASQCETYERAKIKIRQPRVDSRGRELHGAYVIPARCGEEGMLMHLTASRLSSSSHQASPAEKMFVHEFAHLRYGVGDEYYQSVFGYGADGKPSACSVKVEPRISPTTRRYSGFNAHDSPASFMWHQFRSSIMSFCDNGNDIRTKHNRMAANSHNQRCGGLSVWEVLNKSPDFCCGRNRPLSYSDTSLPKPRFRFVQKCRGSCEVVAVDVSASMTGRMMEIQQAAAGVIDGASPSTEMGLITFADRGRVLAPLQKATPKHQSFLKSRLPTDGDVLLEHTSIVEALRLARQLLSIPRCQRKRVTILSDCGETSSERVTSAMISMLQYNGIQLNSLTFDDSAPKCMLPMLSQLSEGTTCNQGDMMAEDAAMSDCMAPRTPKDIASGEHRPHFGMTTLKAREQVCMPVCLESDIGRNTRFSVSWNVGTDRYNSERMWHLQTPSSRHLGHRNSPSFAVDDKLMMSSITVPNAETGVWNVCLHNRLNKPVSFTSNVNTQAKAEGRCAVGAEGFLSGMSVSHPQPVFLMVDVTKCMMPVLDALVTCNITRPSSPPALVLLRDDGMGDDDMKMDGVYTATFSRYMGDGQYNVHCVATCQRRKSEKGDDDDNNNNNDNNDDGGNTGGGEIMTMVRNTPKRMDDAGEESDQLMSGMSMDYPTDDRTVATAMDQCCFVRHLSLGSFTVTGFEEKHMQVLERDMVPPARVHDLANVSIDTSVYPYEATLRFSTTGDNMEVGDAMSYDLRYSAEFEALDSMFNYSMIPEVVNDTDHLRYPPTKDVDMIPKVVTARVRLCIPAQAGNVVLFGMKAMDEVGNVSPLSNIVRLEFDDPSYAMHCPSNIAAAVDPCCLNTVAFMKTPPSPLDWENDDPTINIETDTV